MQPVKISLINGDLLTTPCSIAFLKHIEGLMSTPESAIDAKLDGQLTTTYKEQEKQKYVLLSTDNVFPFQKLLILNFHEDDLPFSYSSLDSYARRTIRYAIKNKDVVSFATPIHGPGSGLDASESLETILSALNRDLQLRGDFGNLQEIIFVEKDKKVYNRLRDRISYILEYKGFIIREGRDMFLNPNIEDDSIDSDQEREEKLLKHVFVAMPFAKELDDVYLFGIKGPVEQRKLKCERVDQDEYTGDIISRIKERIASAEFVIADTTGQNPNVFYEVGYADGIKKRIVFISQQQDLSFDVSTQRHIFYHRQEISSLTTKLGKLIDSLV